MTCQIQWLAPITSPSHRNSGKKNNCSFRMKETLTLVSFSILKHFLCLCILYDQTPCVSVHLTCEITAEIVGDNLYYSILSD